MINQWPVWYPIESPPKNFKATPHARTKDGGAVLPKGLHEVGPLRRLDRGYERAAAEQRGLLRCRWADFGDERGLPDLRRVHDLGAGLLVLFVFFFGGSGDDVGLGRIGLIVYR